MKKQLLISFFALLSLVCINAENNRTIRISTDNIDLILQVGENGRLYQTYLGKKLLYERDVRDFPWNVYAASDGSVSKRVGRCIVALAMKIFLNLPLVSVTVMEIFLLYYIMLLHTINRWKEVWKQSYSCAMINIR